MHKYFADWYRPATVTPTEDVLNARWEGVSAFTKQTSPGQVLDMVRLYFRRRLKEGQSEAGFRQLFKDVDATFAMTGNDLELRLLAAISLRVLIEEREEMADLAALAISTTSFQGLVQPKLMAELVDEAERYLQQQAVEVRRPSESAELPKLKRLQAPTIPEGLDAAQLQEYLKALVASVTQALDGVSNATQQSIGVLDEAIKCQREESDILWWVVSEWSNSRECRFAELPIAFAAVVAGRELADHTEFLPGVFAARAFLQRILAAGRRKVATKTSTTGIVLSCDAGWRSELAAEYGEPAVDDCCPIKFAIVKSLESDGAEDWVPAFKKTLSIEASTELGEVAGALQFYRELLLTRAFRNG